ncbi:MAG: hypothetical protein JRJ84_24185, partial [Deltaproteobacteria bacterium]|nr:hypothetical protein [Deltaproteobacteria bacterium]
WSPPISSADDVSANVPLPSLTEYTWFAFGETDSGTVYYGEHPEPFRHIVMAPPFPGQRTAEAWIDRNCPRWRCTTDGKCATGPARGGSWRVLCDTETGEVTLSEHSPVSMRFLVWADGLLGEPEARLWVELNAPSWRCDASGRPVATGGSGAAGAGDGGGFGVRGTRDGTSESVPGEFVLPDSEEASTLMTEAERAREIAPEIPSTMADLRRELGINPWAEVARAFVGAMSPSGGAGQDCEQMFCPMCADAVDLLGQSADEGCMQCREQYATQIAACYRGESPAAAPQSSEHQLYECVDRYWDPDWEEERWRASYACVPPDGFLPTGCDELNLVEAAPTGEHCAQRRAAHKAMAEDHEAMDRRRPWWK